MAARSVFSMAFSLLVVSAVGLLSITAVSASTFKITWQLPSPVLPSGLENGGPILPGDTLQFNYNTGDHTVLEVTAANFNSCEASKPIHQWKSGPSVVTPSTPGTHYYICGISGHCDAGQKLSVTVAAAVAPESAAAPGPTSGSSDATGLRPPVTASITVAATALLGLSSALLL